MITDTFEAITCDVTVADRLAEMRELCLALGLGDVAAQADQVAVLLRAISADAQRSPSETRETQRIG